MVTSSSVRKLGGVRGVTPPAPRPPTPFYKQDSEAGVLDAEFSRLRAQRVKVVPARLGYAAWRAAKP